MEPTCDGVTLTAQETSDRQPHGHLELAGARVAWTQRKSVYTWGKFPRSPTMCDLLGLSHPPDRLLRDHLRAPFGRAPEADPSSGIDVAGTDDDWG